MTLACWIDQTLSEALSILLLRRYDVEVQRFHVMGETVLDVEIRNNHEQVLFHKDYNVFAFAFTLSDVMSDVAEELKL